jgi:antitoxin component of RelBE/YafQ-DinJ toxin-antitoxin module
MPHEPARPEDKRDEQLSVMLTGPEKAAVAKIADDMGMSLSNAGRFLINRAIAALHPRTPEGE